MKAVRLTTAGLMVTFVTIAALSASPASADHKRPSNSHWDRNTPTVTAVAQVYFEDYSGPNWPVYSEVLAWDDRPAYVRPYYVAAGTCNNNVVHCVNVRSGNYGSADYGGYVEYQMTTNGHFLDGSAKVRYNTYYAYGDNERREITCHEIGHLMGPIGDGTSYTGTCMKPGSPYDFGPNGHDYNILENTYNH